MDKGWGKGKGGGKMAGDAWGMMPWGMMVPGMMGKDGGKGMGKDAWGAMMGKDMGKGMGKGMGKSKEDAYWADYKPGMYFEEPGGLVGIEGLRDAITRACEPHAELETVWKKDDMVNKLCMAIFKTAAKWYKEDTRHKEGGTAIQAQALLE